MIAATRPSSGPAVASRRAAPDIGVLTAGLLGLVVVGLWLSGQGGQLWVFLAGVLVGIPHGSVDHLAWLKPGRTPGRARRALATAACFYGSGLVLALFWFLIDPDIALVATLCLSVYHFGWGEAPGPKREFPKRLALGVVPVLGPLVVWPAASRHIVHPISPHLASIWQGDVLRAGQAVLAMVLVAGVTFAIVTKDRRALGEIGVLGLTVALLPPLSAFACYFALWHSCRHVHRLTEWTAAFGGTERRWSSLYQAALPTVAALGALIMTWQVLPRDDVATVGLVALLGVSVPHTIAVRHMGTAFRDVPQAALSGRGPTP